MSIFIADSNDSIGVVIPTFNRPIQTLKAVQSVLDQTLPVDEIVVVDDGSTQSVQEFLLRELSQYTNVKVVCAEASRHPGRARNVGLKTLRTTWVAFLDSDDIWDPRKIEIQMRIALSKMESAICTNALISSQNGSTKTFMHRSNGKIRFSKLLSQNVIINSSVLIRRSILIDIGGVASSYNVRGAEDFATWLRVGTQTNWYFIDQNLVTYLDDEFNSVRGSDEFRLAFSHASALLDFVTWMRSTNRQRLRPALFFLRLFEISLRISFMPSFLRFIPKSSQSGSTSDEPGPVERDNF